MEPALKTRLIGAAVLIALAVIVVPMFFSGQPQTGNGKSTSLALPPAPDQELTTRTMSVAPPATSAPAHAESTQAAANGDQLASVNLKSRVPKDVHPENDRTPAASPTPDTGPSTPTPAKAPAKATPAPRKSAPAPGNAARGAYSVTLGAYSNSANARDLMRRVRALGYPVQADKVTVGDKTAARISAGPFTTRAAGETARLRLKQAIPNAPAKLVASAGDQHGDAPAKALPAGKAGGWAVQLGAYSHREDALKLRDKLRAAGFDGYIDDVTSNGRKLWRVRVGPRTQRADAEQLRDRLKSRLKLPGVVVTVP